MKETKKMSNKTFSASIIEEYLRKIDLCTCNCWEGYKNRSYKISKLPNLQELDNNLEKLEINRREFIDIVRQYMTENESELLELEYKQYENHVSNHDNTFVEQRRKYLITTNEALKVIEYILYKVQIIISNVKAVIRSETNNEENEVHIRIAYELSAVYDMLKELRNCITRYEYDLLLLKIKKVNKDNLVSREDDKKMRSLSDYYNKMMETFNISIGLDKCNRSLAFDENKSLSDYVRVISDYKFTHIA